MKASDYIVEYLISKGIRHVFGYPGGMVTHLMDSLSKYSNDINTHVTYHEQGAAFAACGYAQASNSVGVAYATSGPGATNLITGICNAYFDSTPVLFITGQVNTFESKDGFSIRQRGFQETDIVSMVKPVTKFAAKITDENDLRWYMDRAFAEATSGRKGPVLLDIPMNIFRAEINPKNLNSYNNDSNINVPNLSILQQELSKSNKPVLVIGNGVKIAGAEKELIKFLKKANIPVVTTMLAVDTIGNSGYGFIGAYGSRTANFIISKSDLVISLGARLDVRQVGAKRENFAPNSKIIRVDIDAGELEYKVHNKEISVCADLKYVLNYLHDRYVYKDLSAWIEICDTIKSKLETIDNRFPNSMVSRISDLIPDGSIITTDVGQNQVWVAQSFRTKQNQRIFFSGGHGAMGYSLPAAIGCALESGKSVYSFNGDGGLQMNIQELQTIVRENLPVKIILFNNYSLGMIRHFQEMYFENNFFQTVDNGGYTVPDFRAISEAYGIPYASVENEDDINNLLFTYNGPQFIEVKISEPTYVFPKLEFGKPNQDQEPLLDRELYNELMSL